ncbi:MAG: Unknown protein [uncultured Sulfurovum sp.]|uniref:DUF1697 domain-containing protein n=1 Tax=uncultured Sulfurovum sp. TaxID=269237 RepID=A0A6S6S0C4_9BACT|nr:MAG: Unknown protein [uncultured Sulfurovum sp.]
MKTKTYISLLRGINVGGHKKILMSDLKALYESLGLERVETFIQSGNVVFNTDKNTETLVEEIQKAIFDKDGFEVLVQIRQIADFENIIKSCPYTKLDLEVDKATKIMITFLDALPKEEDIVELMTYVKAPEQLVVLGKEAYLYCPNGYGKTKLNNNFLENKLKVNATTRNWKSVMRISILAMTNKI